MPSITITEAIVDHAVIKQSAVAINKYQIASIMYLVEITITMLFSRLAATMMYLSVVIFNCNGA